MNDLFERLVKTKLGQWAVVVLVGSGALWVTWNFIYPSGEYVGYWRIVPLVAVVVGVIYLLGLIFPEDGNEGAVPIDDETLKGYRGRK